MAFQLDETFIGIPYLDRGRDPGVGLDCWGLPILFYKRYLNVALPSLLEGYDTARDHQAVTDLVLQQSSMWNVADAPAWARLVTLNVAGRPWHVGVCLDGRHFLHTMEGLGSVIDRLDSPRWQPRVDKYWTYGRRI